MSIGIRKLNILYVIFSRNFLLIFQENQCEVSPHFENVLKCMIYSKMKWKDVIFLVLI